MADKAQISGAQVRMARGFFRWSVADLAKRAGIGTTTVKTIEESDGSPAVSGLEWRSEARDASIEAVRKVLAAAGVTFLPDDGNGVGIRVKGKTQRTGPGGSGGRKTRLRASEMAGRAIDRVDDEKAPAADRARRKRRLLQGPKEFREFRGDLPKPKQ